MLAKVLGLYTERQNLKVESTIDDGSNRVQASKDKAARVAELLEGLRAGHIFAGAQGIQDARAESKFPILRTNNRGAGVHHGGLNGSGRT